MKFSITRVLAGVFALALAPATFAAPKCTNADLNGTYGMLASGSILIAPGFPAGLIGPFARVGHVYADGKGNVSIANVASYNGNIIPESYGGTYTVNSDCTTDIVPSWRTAAGTWRISGSRTVRVSRCTGE